MATIKLIQHDGEEQITESYYPIEDINYVDIIKEKRKGEWVITRIIVYFNNQDSDNMDFEGEDLEPNYRALEPWMKNQERGEAI